MLCIGMYAGCRVGNALPRLDLRKALQNWLQCAITMDGIYTSCDPNIIWYVTSCETCCNVKSVPSTHAVPRISLGVFFGLDGCHAGNTQWS